VDQVALVVGPSGVPYFEARTDGQGGKISAKMIAALESGVGSWLTYLVTAEQKLHFTNEIEFCRTLSRLHISRLVRVPGLEELNEFPKFNWEAGELVDPLLNRPPSLERNTSLKMS
jgi:hypothetical protein